LQFENSSLLNMNKTVTVFTRRQSFSTVRRSADFKADYRACRGCVRSAVPFSFSQTKLGLAIRATGN
jgi:hypothetical protein